MSELLFGICTPPERAEMAKKCGCDYIECHFSSFATMSEDDFAAAKQQLSDAAIEVKAMNGMFPSDISLYDYVGDKTFLIDYMKRGFERSSIFGVKTVVFGSGRARAIPDGMNRENAVAAFSDLLFTACNMASPYGITIAVEPLRAEETNFIHTVSDTAKIIENLPCGVDCGINPDFTHMRHAKEPFSEIPEHNNLIRHAHICSDNRKYPMPDDAEAERLYPDFVRFIASCGKCGEISIEGGFISDYEEDLKRSMEYLHTLKF